MDITVSDRLTALGHPVRLSLFRLLMRRFPDRIPAGEIADILHLRQSTLSGYLARLMQVGLVTQDRAGTFLLYSVNMDGTRETIEHLMSDCCRGRPDLCTTPAITKSAKTVHGADRTYDVLFICTGNSARSIFAEALLRDLGKGRFNAVSAGTRPAPAINRTAADVLQKNGHDIGSLRAKSTSEFKGPDAPVFDFVFTVCDQAANQDCVAWEGQPISGHWGLADPAALVGTEAERSLAFHQTYKLLKRRIEAFVALPLDSLDLVALQTSIDQIGRCQKEWA